MPGTLRIRNALIVLTGACSLLATSCTSGQDHVLRDIDGISHGSMERPTEGNWNVLFFVTAACPISNQYAPEIQRICSEYGPRGARCFLVYADPFTTVADVRNHRDEFGHTSPAIFDSSLELAKTAGATATPEAAVFSGTGSLMYLGRINDFYTALGRPRQRVGQHDLRNALDDLAAGREVRIPRTEPMGCFISAG